LGVLNLLSGVGYLLFCASLIGVFVGILALLVYRIRKGLVISPMGPLSELVVLGIFIMPPASLFAYFGSVLGRIWEPALWALTAVGAIAGLIIGVYLWIELH
jgi:hypothetical protein